MFPGFIQVGHSPAGPEYHQRPAIFDYAGLWDPPPQEECRFVRTDTFCTGLVMWCKEVSVCRGGDNPFFGREVSRTPYPCGVCVGITDPSDW